MHPSLVAAYFLAGVLLTVTAGMWVLGLLGLLTDDNAPQTRACGHDALFLGDSTKICWHCHWAKAKDAVALVTHRLLPHH